MPQKKPKSRKKVAPKRLQALAKARLFKDATYEARRPLGYTRSHEPDQPRTAQLHGSVVALTLLCACCTGGLAARWLVAAALPREHREETRLRDAHTGELVSFIICNGVVPARLKQQLVHFANTAVRDDTIVRERGCGPRYVHLRDTNYPSCRRVTMGACYKTLPNPIGQAVLAGYSQNYCPSGLTSMRHMPPFIAQIGECLWRAAHHKLPELCKERPPNVCVMQTYRRGRGDFMDYHTDSRQTYAGQTIAQDHDTAVITYTIGSSDMRFCYHDYDYKGKKLPKQHYFMLYEDEALVWMPRDDHRKKHGVWWAPGTPKDAVRHVLVFRWTNVNAKRAYYTEYPHRPVATDKETEEMFNPNISDYVRGFGMDEIQDEQDYEEWVQAGKPECVPVACPRGMRAAMRAAA